MTEQIMAYPYKGILSNKKSNELLVHVTWINLKIIIQVEGIHILRFHSYKIQENAN